MNTSERASAHVSYTNWKAVQMYVTKLRQRIYRAEQLQQQRKVRKLQRLLMRSEANLLLSIRRVTQQNKGKRTAGVDEHTALSRREKIFSMSNSKVKYATTPTKTSKTYIHCEEKRKIATVGHPNYKG